MKKIFTLLVFITASFTINAQVLTEVLVPQFMQGFNGTNSNRIPYAYRVTLSGLTPSATYRYYNSVINTTETATSNGAGNIIYPNEAGFTAGSQSLSTAGAYGEFTTDGTGSYTGWFITEPTGNATRFTPGTIVQLRIVLNNGSGGTTAVTRLTTTSTATIINFGTTTADGTALRSTPGDAMPKNFVMLYDNEAGTGRPIAGIYVENDGLAAGTSYSGFYKTDVDAQNGAWGTIIPNNLPNGIRRIAQYSITTGNMIGAATSADGTWPSTSGTVSTVNPNSGTTTVLVINGSSISLPLNLTAFRGSLNANNSVQLTWASANEQNVKGFTVERSGDGRLFNPVGEVAANNRVQSSYTFTDAKPGTGINYYRLKMTDKDGAVKYSSVIAISNRKGITASVFPNPAVGQITVSHTKANKGAILRILTSEGRQIKTSVVEAGAIQSTLTVNELAKGNYILVFENEGEKTTSKFVKQ